MSVGLYMDVHVPYAITTELRLRACDVLTAQEDEAGRFTDQQLLRRASELGRVLVTQDDDLLREATMLQQRGEAFVEVIYHHPLRTTIGQCVSELELIARATEAQDWASRVEFLPLR